jgi:hypothetical protein
VATGPSLAETPFFARRRLAEDMGHVLWRAAGRKWRFFGGGVAGLLVG